MDSLVSYAYESPLDSAVVPHERAAEFNPFPLEQARPVTPPEALAHYALLVTFADRTSLDY